MKRILTLLVLQLHVVGLFAQREIISEKEFLAAVSEAGQQNKLIFVDFYADWCVPCKLMDKEVFSLDDIKNLMNQKFVFLKVNAEKNYGVELAKQYAVRSYPTFVVLQQDRKETFRFIGKKSPTEFKELIAKHLDTSRSDVSVASRYAAGERSPQLMQDYLVLLRKEGKDREAELALHEYFNALSEEEKHSADNWFVFSQYTPKFTHPRIKYLLQHQVSFERTLGKEKVQSYLMRLGRVELLAFANGNKANKALNHEQHYAFLKQYLVDSKLIEQKNIEALVKIADARFKFDNKEQALLVAEEEFANLTASDKFILMANMFARKEADAESINAVQKRILRQNIKELSEDNQKIIRRMLDAYEKFEFKNGVQFENLDYQQTLLKASKDNKLVFIDFYTDWCGPCKVMSAEVFPTQVVGEFMNPKFVSVKINAEKGEGVQISKKYKINAYPTMVVDASGKELGRIVGYKTPRELIEDLSRIIK